MFRMRLKTALVFFAGSAVVGSAIADRSEFEKWLSQETTTFQEYRDKRDKEFTSFLKTQWKEMETFSGLVRDKTPKPVRIASHCPLPCLSHSFNLCQITSQLKWISLSRISNQSHRNQ